ncbi:MAG: HD domain-containing protein [Oscillospiraceae bacterium]|nr:HD domain-containing protein [Oscillospiraceae bacterium]
MRLKKSSYIVNIIQNTLNHMDGRLVDHGKRVSYLVYKVLKRQNKYTQEHMRDICILALIHDIGAYKTEEVHNMVAFETGAVWEHSAYGYLFAKHFSPLKYISPVLLFHHAALKDLEYLHPSYHEIAQIIFIADRIDVLALSGIENWDAFVDSFDKLCGTLFSAHLVDLFFRGEGCITQDDLKFDYSPEFIDILYNSDFSAEGVDAYLNMVVLSIEFRSPQTMNHTFALIKTCEILGRKAGLDEGEIESLQTGALLHDVGKVGVPLHILESSDRLSDEEFEIMKSHISITKNILGSYLDESVLSIAANHHEKLDGSGYVSGLKGDEIQLCERIVSVADIFCALSTKRSYKEPLPKEKVLSIMSEMKDAGYIDPALTKLTEECYEELETSIAEITEKLAETYVALWEEYDLLLSMVDTFKQGLGSNEMYIKEPLAM